MKHNNEMFNNSPFNQFEMITCYSSSDRVADSMGPDHSNNSCKRSGSTLFAGLFLLQWKKKSI